MSKPLAVEIVPGQSIGAVKLGMATDALPRHAVIQPPSGSLDGIQFLVSQAGVVEDIWIDDLRVFPRAVSCAGKEIPHDISLDGVGALFGKCERVPGLKGGIFFNCANGLAIGTDFAHQSLQVRVKPLASGG